MQRLLTHWRYHHWNMILQEQNPYRVYRTIIREPTLGARFKNTLGGILSRMTYHGV